MCRTITVMWTGEGSSQRVPPEGSSFCGQLPAVVGSDTESMASHSSSDCGEISGSSVVAEEHTSS